MYMKWIVYSLSCPRTKVVRYIGWTKRTAKARLGQHITESVRYQRTHKQKWIASLLGSGLIPTIEIIESGSGQGWAEAEQRWIAIYRARGARLVNATDGGEGIVGGWGTFEQMSAAMKKWHALETPEHRTETAKKGYASMTPEQRFAFQAAGIQASKSYWISKTPKERSAIATRRQANLTKEQRSAAAIKRWLALTADERLVRMARLRERIMPEHRATAGKHTRQTRVANGVSEDYRNTARANAIAQNAATTPEQRVAINQKISESIRRNRTSQERSEAARKREAAKRPTALSVPQGTARSVCR
jgi:hypothetical protein